MRSVIIVGAGPAGLTAARVLADAGLKDVLVLDRNREAGGLPRCVGHLGWGLVDRHRILTGPGYARQLVAATSGVEIRTDVTVTALLPGGRLEVSSRAGLEILEARSILLATGIRETPRSARLVSGTRPWGVITTGTFQDNAYRGSFQPFRTPVIVGSELVSFSALLTARHAGARPAAMLEEGNEAVARWPAGPLGAMLFRVPLRLNTRLVEIRGRERVEAVRVEGRDGIETIPCDSVIFSGQFVPEASLVRNSHLAFDSHTGGPAIDNEWRCSDPAYHAAGNLLRGVEHSGMAAWEGKQAARAILNHRDRALPAGDAAVVTPGGALRYVYPQRIVPNGRSITLYARVARRFDGTLRVEADGTATIRRRLRSAPERRITVRIPQSAIAGARTITMIAD